MVSLVTDLPQGTLIKTYNNTLQQYLKALKCKIKTQNYNCIYCKLLAAGLPEIYHTFRLRSNAVE